MWLKYEPNVLVDLKIDKYASTCQLNLQLCLNTMKKLHHKIICLDSSSRLPWLIGTMFRLNSWVPTTKQIL